MKFDIKEIIDCWCELRDDLIRLKINTKFVLRMVDDATPSNTEERQQLEKLRLELKKIELSLRDYKDHIEEASSIGGEINAERANKNSEL